MPLRIFFALLVASWCYLSYPVESFAQTAAAPTTRHFTFHYGFTVKDVKAGERLRIWIPLAHSDAFQDVRIVNRSGDLPLQVVRQPEYGSEVLYTETSQTKNTGAKSGQSDYKFSVDYDVVRKEHVTLANGRPLPASQPAKISHIEAARFLQADRLVPVTGLPAQLAGQETAGASTRLLKAKAIYDYVLRTMKYDKSGAGWGHGDTLWACDSKRGNCTDFHSVFISMARAEKIPARFEIGFPLPADKHAAEIPGYHCWAEFYLDGTGWVPVDVSEAWKHPEKRDYFFGAHDVNRMQFTVGRDLKLIPAQDGPALNYFVYPYVEVGGAEYPNVSIDFSFADTDVDADAETSAKANAAHAVGSR